MFCQKLKSVLQWVWGALVLIGMIILYRLILKKDGSEERLKQLEKEIAYLQNTIKALENERKLHLDNANQLDEQGKLLDKQIEEHKKKQQNLKEKRDLAKSILEKYK